MIRRFLFAAAALALFSCSSKNYYQVYQTTSGTVTQKTAAGVIAYEDAKIRVAYNLWANQGEAGFALYNKTDEVIKLRLDESFYVLNGIAHDYYGRRVFEEGSTDFVSRTNSFGYGRFGWVNMYASGSVSSGKVKSVSVQEAAVLSIPPKTARHVSEYRINQVLYRDCDLLRFPSARKVTTKSFAASDAPLQFYNLIVYTIGQSEVRQSVKNDFAVTAITNYPEKVIMRKLSKEFCGDKAYNPIFEVGDAAPDKFYLKYTKDNEPFKH